MSSTQQARQSKAEIVTNGTDAASVLTEAKMSFGSPLDVNVGPEDIRRPEKCFKDSGFYEDNGNPPNYVGSEDWTLYDEDVTGEIEDYFTEDEILDIASIKANHGSIYNGTKNRSTVQIPPGTSYGNSGSSDVRTAFFDPIREATRVSDKDEDEKRPQHHYSTFDTNPTGKSSLQNWISIPERHESIAYRFQQLAYSAQDFHPVQRGEEDIDLEDFRQPYY